MLDERGRLLNIATVKGMLNEPVLKGAQEERLQDLHTLVNAVGTVETKPRVGLLVENRKARKRHPAMGRSTLRTNNGTLFQSQQPGSACIGTRWGGPSYKSTKG